MRLLFAGILFIGSYLSFSQLTVKPIRQSEKISTTTHLRGRIAAEPATLPFWDDFSISDRIIDSTRTWDGVTYDQWDYELSRGIFVNSTLSINPPSYQAATFDGLDEDGGFYSTDTNAKDLTDELVSSIIDLTGFEEDDNLVLSFFWQAGGNVEVPEVGDSLRLQFLNADSTWVTRWFMQGNENLDVTEFTETTIQVTSAYLSDHFRFRFQAFGDQDGPFDAWHLDWIYLNANRTNFNGGYLDGSFNGELSSPFTPFQSLPIEQFGENIELIQNQQIGIRSLNLLSGEPGLFPVDINYELTNTNTNTLIIQDSDRAYPLLSSSTRLDTLVRLMLSDESKGFVLLEDQDFSSLNGLDSVVLRTSASLVANDEFLEGSIVDLRVNDTIQHEYTLHNYLAFDDGTAEFAAGTNIRTGQVAVRFWLSQSDTLTHVDINFPNIAPILQTPPTLSLQILDDLENNGLLRIQQITVDYNEERDQFTRYELERPVIVSDTFFIAYQQFVNDYIGIGFDRSNLEASPHIFENKDGNWTQNVSLNGALMIRPVFERGIELTLGVNEIENVKVYPNPTDGIVRIENDYQYVELLDLSGKILFSENRRVSHDFTKFEEGLYLLRIHLNNTQLTQKIILK